MTDTDSAVERRIEIGRTWDGRAAGEPAPAVLLLTLDAERLTVDVDAPFHGDVPPAAPAGRVDGLWNHEVVELFLVGDDGRYLELELGPHGHWLGLLLQPVRRVDDDQVPVEFDCRVDGARWRARAGVEASFVPRRIVRWNAFAIHGSGANRRYLAASALPGDEPDFHRIDRFPSFDDRR